MTSYLHAAICHKFLTEVTMAAGKMKTTLTRSTDETGAVEWRLPSEIEGFIENLPEEKRALMRTSMSMMLSACAHAICAEIDYSIRTGCTPLRDMLAAFAGLAAFQMQRVVEANEDKPPDRKH